MGAATMAAIGVGQYADFADAYDALALFDRTFTPDQAKHAQYNDLYGLYKEAISINASLGKRISQLNSATGSR